MRKPTIVVTDAARPQIDAVLGGGLNAFNKEMAGYTDHQPLSVIIEDPQTGAPIGGATGRSSLGLLFLDLFYLPLALRGSGIGTEVLARFEAEGRRRGCRAAVLYTISFQAPGFYEKNGWRRFGEIACDPEGISRIFMTKDLI